MRILFVTRSFPPGIGGMEKFAFDFFENYHQGAPIDLLANTRGKKYLPLFLLRVIFTLLFRSRDYDLIHIYDAVLSPLVVLVRAVSRAKVTFTVNGLDIVFSRFGYQKFMPYFLKKADLIIPISQFTAEQCLRRGIPAEKIRVIPVGYAFNPPNPLSNSKKQEILAKYSLRTPGQKILLTVGRLVRRKGQAWFIENVLPRLPASTRYLIAGVGPEFENIKNLIEEKKLSEQVTLLGAISDSEKNELYAAADLFIMPNISVENDQEGFGIVLLEAGEHQLPVIASNIEGIMDVVFDQSTGFLIQERDAQGFIAAIENCALDTAKIPKILEDSFGWDKVIHSYKMAFEALF